MSVSGTQECILCRRYLPETEQASKLSKSARALVARVRVTVSGSEVDVRVGVSVKIRVRGRLRVQGQGPGPIKGSAQGHDKGLRVSIRPVRTALRAAVRIKVVNAKATMPAASTRTEAIRLRWAAHTGQLQVTSSTMCIRVHKRSKSQCECTIVMSRGSRRRLTWAAPAVGEPVVRVRSTRAVDAARAIAEPGGSIGTCVAGTHIAETCHQALPVLQQVGDRRPVMK